MAVAMALNFALACVPISPTATMQTTAINATIKAYSGIAAAFVIPQKAAESCGET